MSGLDSRPWLARRPRLTIMQDPRESFLFAVDEASGDT